MKKSKKFLIVLGVCVGVAALCFIFFWLLPKVFNQWFSEDDLEAFLSNTSGIRGPLYLALIQVFQVVSIFFPGAVVQVAGGLVFGVLKAFLVCLAAFVGTNILVFLLARLYRSGKPNAKRRLRVQKVIDWINSSDPFFMCMLAYMMPGIPNGFVPYAAVHTNITARQFSVSVLLGSLFQIFINCAIGSRIMSGDYAISFVMTLGSLVLIFVLYKTKDKLIDFAQKHRRNRPTARKT